MYVFLLLTAFMRHVHCADVADDITTIESSGLLSGLIIEEQVLTDYSTANTV